jgi:2-oxo-4-hydroxy-4-carboxy-5-ureidoimidazoline decarboxylase
VQISELNLLDDATAAYELERCCGSKRWVAAMMKKRPFADYKTLLRDAEDAWWQLGAADWKEAFSCHPKIGELGKIRDKFAPTATWTRIEQSGVGSADETTLRSLAELNAQYDKKFGYIFIICATGKRAEDMLAALRQRLNNNPDSELRIAALEQSRITALRLEKLCAEAPSQPTS